VFPIEALNPLDGTRGLRIQPRRTANPVREQVVPG
jgi:hypothetical protein